jgi:hypothetical protein
MECIFVMGENGVAVYEWKDKGLAQVETLTRTIEVNNIYPVCMYNAIFLLKYPNEEKENKWDIKRIVGGNWCTQAYLRDVWQMISTLNHHTQDRTRLKREKYFREQAFQFPAGYAVK